MKLSNLDWMFKKKKRNENEWNVRIFVWKQNRGNEIETFYNNITIRPQF